MSKPRPSTLKFPSVKGLASILREVNQEDLEPEDADEGIDVRLQVYQGGWDVHSGDAQYDTDHRGYWGASTVPGNGRSFDSTAVAHELIEEAKDSAAMDGERFRNPFSRLANPFSGAR